MYACCLAAGAESLAIGGRRGCRALNPLWDVDPVRAAVVRPYVLRTVDWSLAVADYLPRARRCLVAVPRRVFRPWQFDIQLVHAPGLAMLAHFVVVIPM